MASWWGPMQKIHVGQRKRLRMRPQREIFPVFQGILWDGPIPMGWDTGPPVDSVGPVAIAWSVAKHGRYNELVFMGVISWFIKQLIYGGPHPVDVFWIFAWLKHAFRTLKMEKPCVRNHKKKAFLLISKCYSPVPCWSHPHHCCGPSCEKISTPSSYMFQWSLNMIHENVYVYMYIYIYIWIW